MLPQINTELLRLRRCSYRAASEYHRVTGEWFAALGASRDAQAQVSILEHHQEAALLYLHAFDDLIAHLRAAASQQGSAEELRHVQKLRALLVHEMRLTP